MTDSATFWQANRLKRLEYLEQALRGPMTNHYWNVTVLGGTVDRLTKYENRILIEAIKQHECRPHTRSMGGALGYAIGEWGPQSPNWIPWRGLPYQMFGAKTCEYLFFDKALKGARSKWERVTPIDTANAINYYLETGKYRFPTLGKKK